MFLTQLIVHSNNKPECKPFNLLVL